MNTSGISNNPNNTSLSTIGTQNGIEYHEKIGENLIVVAVNHFKTASHLKNGGFEKVIQSNILAREYFNLVNRYGSNC
jgi:hypothetical protein